MPQTTDVEIGGAGYMLAPGTYRREQDGLPEGRPGRVAVRDFFGGQRRAFQLERDRGWDGLGVGPAYDGQGVEPWPNEAAHADGSLAEGPTATTQAIVATAGPGNFLGLGNRIYETVALGAGAWANVVQRVNLGVGVVVTGMAWYKGNLVVCAGTTNPVKTFDTATFATANLNDGTEFGHRVVSYAGTVMWSQANSTGSAKRILRIAVDKHDGTVVFRQKKLDSPIANLALMGGKVAIVTRTSLYLLAGEMHEGSADAGDQPRFDGKPEPIFSHGLWTGEEDFAFLLGYGGKLYTWLANRVMEWDPSLARDRWRAVGPEGRRCHGACVAAGTLLVATESRAGAAELWAFDGSGWWRLSADPAGGTVRVWPSAVAGAGNRDAVVFRAGSTTYDLLRLVPRSTALHTYRAAGEWVSSLLDCGQRDRPKAWRKVGAVFAAPEPRGAAVGGGATGDELTVALHTSLDAGATWTQAATLTTTGQLQRTIELEADLPASVARWLQLKVTWASVSDWAPVLVGAWAEYELLEVPARRRKWRFKVVARDGQVRRDGQVQARTGRQLAADLWAAWEAGTTLAFRDVDYDAAPVPRNVRIVGIAEEVPRPADAGRWGEAQLSLTLVEV
jgi:hypothetical protein